jgi:hypothetical protein
MLDVVPTEAAGDYDQIRCDAVDSMDLVIEVYKKHVDQTLLDECLKRTLRSEFKCWRSSSGFGKSCGRG